MQRLHSPNRLRPTGPDERVADAELGERRAEGLRRKLTAVVTEHALQPAAWRSAATRRASLDVCAPVGLPRGQLRSSAQAKEEWTSVAVSCQTDALVPRGDKTLKAVPLDPSLPDIVGRAVDRKNTRQAPLTLAQAP